MKVISIIFAALATLLGIVSLVTSNDNLLPFMFLGWGISRIIDDIGLYKQSRKGLVIINFILSGLIIIIGIIMVFSNSTGEM